MRTIIVVALSVGLLCVPGCGQARPAQPAVPGSADVRARFAGPAVGAAAMTIDKPETSEPVPVPTRRKLIRNASVTLEVDSVDSALAAIRAAAQSLAGYVSEESQSQDTVQGPRASLTCRVPADKLDAMLARVKSLGRPRDVTVTAEDITERYFDLEMRLRNGRQFEARLLQLLARPGNNLADLLNVERELARVRNDLDQLEGRQRLWDNQVGFSTLRVNIEGPRPVLAAGEGGILSALKTAVTNAGENFVAFVAGLIAALGWLLPLTAALAIGVWILRRLWRLVRGRRSAGGVKKSPTP